MQPLPRNARSLLIGIGAALLLALHQPGLPQSASQDSVPKLEDRLLAQIKKEGIGNRLHIKDLKPQGYIKEVMRFTVSQPKTADGKLGNAHALSTEYPEDRMMGGTYAISVVRFDGEVRMGKHMFINGGEKGNRLTFALLDQGFVYLRGKGKVVLSTGQSISLGD